MLAYGWGFNYLVWIVPFLFVTEPLPICGAYLALATATTLAVFYGFGGVYPGILHWFSLDSALWRYGWTMSLPLWVFCIALLARATRSARQPVRSQAAQSTAQRRRPLK